MNALHAPRLGWRATAAFGVALALSAATGATATAAPVAFTGGHVDWGVKQSFRAYVDANPADGAVRVSGGAYRTADGGIRFPVDYTNGGGYDAGTGDGEIRLRGTVRFTRHQTAPGSGIYQLDLTIAALRLAVASNDGSLVADVTSKSMATGEVSVIDDLELATADLTAAGPAAGPGERFTWASSPTLLTSAGAPVFGGFYSQGEPLDPVSATASYGAPSIPPAAPVLSTDPASPANQNDLRVRGTAPAGTTVRLYRGTDCLGAPIASGSPADLANPGLPATVPDDSTTSFTALAVAEDGASDCSAPATYVEKTRPADDGTPPPRQGPPANPSGPTGAPAALIRLRGARLVNGKGMVTIARIHCKRGPCRVSPPKRVRLKIAKRSFWAQVKAPRLSATGAKPQLRLKLPPKAVKRLAGRRATVRLRIVVVVGGERQSLRLRATLKRPRP
jgi:hypothetical protein